MPISKVNPSSINKAAALLAKGKLIGLPTETVYGLAGDAANPEALALIFSTKQRPEFDPLILHAYDMDMALTAVIDFPRGAQKMAEAFWPGPLTLILPKAPWVPDLATSGLKTVAIRVPKHRVARQVIKSFGGCLAAPSANRFGRLSPTTAAAVFKELGSKVSLILDGGPCAQGIESTIISYATNKPICLRLGALSLEEIEEKLGQKVTHLRKVNPRMAPGNIGSHYAPRTPLRIVNSPSEVTDPKKASWVSLKPVEGAGGFKHVRFLTRNGDLSKAASRFFQTLRELDELNTSMIYAQPFPDTGLGRALNDRLTRAAQAAR
ncbi:MAG: L-threonylcarbamoyladenylate synthase [Verrucomicrobiota bacterium]|nr:L-threonylcarbamoyladenylate synthase [Verrucomicrobiota bacterium]